MIDPEEMKRKAAASRQPPPEEAAAAVRRERERWEGWHPWVQALAWRWWRFRAWLRRRTGV